MKKSIGLTALVLGLVAVAGSVIARGAANADIRLPLTYQQGRADSYTCPSPAPQGSSGKIVTVPGTTEFYGTVNCTGPTTAQAYLYHGRPPGQPIVTRLRLAEGANGAHAFGVAANGEVVGYMRFGSVLRPYRWVAGGEAIALDSPSAGYATAVGRTGLPIVGNAVDKLKVTQAAWFAPAPGFFIPPARASGVFAVIASSTPAGGIRYLYAGDLGGYAADGVAPGPLTQLPVGHPSTALAINVEGYIAGRELLSGKCGPYDHFSGFLIPFADGKAAPVPPLPGDCASSAEDLNDGNAVVGYSLHPKPAVQRAEGFNLTDYPRGLVDLNTTQRYGAPPWAQKGHRLIAATGTDDRGDIAATDSAGTVWFLHIP